ncbi:MAG TPA: beta-ketoacyl-ACP synthase II [Acidimicrobiales bacterium]|nr:beta-ketoacyl-ACP synthase II [Acidimicrobiales bacterium]
MERRRVVVTGMGVKTPAGNTLDSFWETLLAASATAAGPIERVDVSDWPVQFACEVKGFDPEEYIDAKEVRRTDRVAQLGYAAAVDALRMAGDLGLDPARIGVVAGTGVGGLETQEREEIVVYEKGKTRVSPFLVPMMMTNATAAMISMGHGLRGPNLCIATACAAGTNAIGEAAHIIRYGGADAIVAGGSEAAITPVGMAAFARMGALSTRRDDPATASRPFDATRDGFVMGEGGAFLVLEEYEHAVARGATILGEILGYGRNADAHHITAPSPDGAGAIGCMEAALADAGLTPGDIGHVNAHGTSTPLNDAAESAAIYKTFNGSPPPVVSTKGVTGHCIGAAGAIECVAALLASTRGVVPPTANHTERGEGIEVDVVHGSPREVAPAPALSNSFGFGGHNGTLVVGPVAS